MNVEYTPHAREALDGAEAAARHFNHAFVGSEHVLLSILAIPGCGACRRLAKLGLAAADLRMELEQAIGRGDPLRVEGPLPMTARTRKILEFAKIEAKRAGAKAVGTEHVVTALLREGESVGAGILFNHDVTADRFIKGAAPRGSGAAPLPQDDDAQSDAAPFPQDDDADAAASLPQDDDDADDAPDEKKDKGKTPALNCFGRDLTKMAAQAQLDPVIGRTKEIARVVQVLCRRTKNNAVLIGEAGVGKTAVVEGLAQAIAAGDVPERMRGKRVVSLDMARVVAGTQYRGQFEERLKQIVEEAKRVKNVVLFLDEIHTLVGAGGAEGAMDAANILKPALSRGELQCVGATTLKEYHKSIEKDAALERRFQSVSVDEPSPDDAVAILRGIAPRYEEYHKVRYAPEALAAAVRLTARYLPARLLPDKAIDAIDETGARVRMRHAVRPPDLKEGQERIAQIRARKDEAIAREDYDAAAACRDEELAARKRLDDALATWKKEHAEKTVDVSEDDVAETVAALSGVPVERMNAAAVEKLLDVEKDLEGAVVGQTEAISLVARALRRARAALGDPRRPIGSFLFLGPTGVGKTLLAKKLAEKTYGDAKALVALDMTEFSDKFTSSRLVGAPPGYVGYDEGGQLTERVRRRPYSVVLFDEFEKASPDVMNMLLQILDEGKLTDGQGRVVDFRNTVIICTANLGLDFAREGRHFGFADGTAADSHEQMRARLLEEAKRTFRPELLNRFDETIVFRKLGKDDVAKVLALELAPLRERLAARGKTLALDAKAVDFLVAKGSDDALGARPLRRAVQRFLEDPLAELLLREKLKPGKIAVTVNKDGDALAFEAARRRFGKGRSSTPKLLNF